MKVCPNCQESHEKRGAFCCRSCANSRTWSQEDRNKKSQSAIGFYESLSSEEKVNRLRKANLASHTPVATAKRKATWVEKRAKVPWDRLSYRSRRLIVIEEQHFRCLECGIDEWNDKPIVLQIDHIDGDRKNNARDNLRGLCPNCHSQTDDWCTHVDNNRRHKITDEELIEAFEKAGSVARALAYLGLSRGSEWRRLTVLVEWRSRQDSNLQPQS